MNILVFGSTGGTGKQIVQQALEAGHLVTAVARDPSVLNIKHQNVNIIQADVLQPQTFEADVRGKDVVLSALGFKKLKDAMVYAAGVGNIAACMQQHAIKRIICISAAAVETNPKLSFVYRLFTRILQMILKNPYADLLRMEHQLKETNLDWTVVRPPKLSDTSLTGKYRYAINEWLPHCTKISRADVAHFMLHHIKDDKTYNSIIEVAY
jgi:putative NADH-flavin reductase